MFSDCVFGVKFMFCFEFDNKLKDIIVRKFKMSLMVDVLWGLIYMNVVNSIVLVFIVFC